MVRGCTLADYAPVDFAFEEFGYVFGQASVLRSAQSRVVIQNLGGQIARVSHELLVFHDVGDFKVKDSALLCALQVAGTAEFEVEVGDFESVGGAHHRVEALLALVAELVA